MISINTIKSKGNNENEWGISLGWWNPRLPQYDTDYRKLYVDTIYKITSKEDNTRPFVFSSPSNGLETIKENYISKNPGDGRYGDMHYYNDGEHLWDWHKMPNSRFVSEYGFESFPSLQAFADVLNDSDLTYPTSPAIEHRQRHGGGTQRIQTQICKKTVLLLKLKIYCNLYYI